MATVGCPSVDPNQDYAQPLLSSLPYHPYGASGPLNVDNYSTDSLAKKVRFCNDEENYDYKCGLSPVRRMFCTLALFDFLFIFLMWIIYAQLFSTGLKQQFIVEVINYRFHLSLFDLVVCAFLRTLCLGTMYALLKSKRWYMVALTTGISTVFIIAKVFKIGNSLSKGQPMSYLLLIASFVICWSEVWHFDFQVIPTELKHAKKSFTNSLPSVLGQDSISYGSWYRRPPESDQRSFYTANCTAEPDTEISDSDESFAESTTTSSPFPIIMTNELADEGKSAVSQTLKMLFITEGWKVNKKDDDIIVSSREFDDIGQVFKCEAVIDCPPRLLYKILWKDIESQPAWNSNVAECHIIKRLDKNTDVCHVVATDAGGGLIKSRDFVTVRRYKQKGNLRLLCTVSTTCSIVPEKKGVIRGENGPGGFILKDVAESPDKTELIWLLNTNLKGWIPRKVVDQTMGSVMADTMRSLKTYVSSVPSV